MAFVLIFVAVAKAAKDNPQLLSDWKKKLTPTKLLQSSQPSLLKGTVRSESEVKGVLEVTVKSVLGLDDLPLDDVKPTDGVEEQWEIDSENDTLGSKVLAVKSDAMDSVTGSVDRHRVVKFSVFEDQPETMQLYLSVRRKGDPVGVSHLAVANIPISVAVSRGLDRRTVPLVLERGLRLGDPSKVIGSVKITLQYVHRAADPYDSYGSYSARGSSVQPVDSYDWGSSGSSGSAVSSRKKKAWGLAKMSTALRHYNPRRRGELMEDDDSAGGADYSAYL